MATAVRLGQTAQRRPRLGPRLSRVNIAVWRLVAFGVFVAIWWIASALSGESFMPSPWATAQAGIRMFAGPEIYQALADSLTVFASGYLVAAVVAIPLGLLMGGFRVLGATLDPYVNALTATPRVAFIPLIIVFLGLGYEAKITIVFLGAVMPIVINTYAGVLNSDGELIEMARSAGAGDTQIFRKVMLPGAMPYIVAGLRLGAALGLINTVVAELYTAVKGLGGLLSVYGNTFQMAPYFVVVLMFATIGIVATQGLRIVERRLERWRDTSN